jgi:hypothetical protein
MKKTIGLLCVFLLMGFHLLFAEEEAGEQEDQAAGSQRTQEGKHFARHFEKEGQGREFERGDKREMLKNWMHREMPEIAKRLENLKTENPEAFRTFMQQRRENFHELFMGKKRGTDKETKETLQQFLNNELDSLLQAEKVKNTTEEKEKEKLKVELKATLTRGFDLKEKLQSKMIEKMNERIESLRQMLEKRKEMKDRIISERLDELTGDEKQEVRW